MREAVGLIRMLEVARPHGLKGEVFVRNFAENLAAHRDLVSEDGRGFHLSSVRRSAGKTVVKLAGVDDRTAAEKIAGLALFIDRRKLPALEAGEFYHADLIGLQARPLDIAISAVHNFGAGDILELADGRMIPFTKEAVPEIEVERGYVTLDLAAAGLTE